MRREAVLRLMDLGLRNLRPDCRAPENRSPERKKRPRGHNCVHLVRFFAKNASIWSGFASIKGGFRKSAHLVAFSASHLVITLVPASAGEAVFEQLLADLTAEDGGACRVAVAEHRITEWRGGPWALPAFGSVEEIMSEFDPVDAIIDGGCDAQFVWTFMACTQLDNPDATHIVPRGVTADTDAEFAEVLRRCFASLAAEGPRP